MRWLLSATLLTLAAGSAPAEENEAEKLFRAMVEKVRAAKTVRLRYDLDITDARGKKWALKGAVTLGEGDKAHIESEGRLFGEAIKFTVVSDGAAMKSFGVPEPPKNDKADPSPKGVGAYLRESLPRDGLFESLLHLERRDDKTPEAKRSWKPSGFSMGGEEKVGGRDARLVRYQVPARLDGEGEERLSMAVWIDVKTGLPVRRAMTGGQSDVKALTETYSEFALDAEVGARLFHLPK